MCLCLCVDWGKLGLSEGPLFSSKEFSVWNVRETIYLRTMYNRFHTLILALLYPSIHQLIHSSIILQIHSLFIHKWSNLYKTFTYSHEHSCVIIHLSIFSLIHTSTQLCFVWSGGSANVNNNSKIISSLIYFCSYYFNTMYILPLVWMLWGRRRRMVSAKWRSMSLILIKVLWHWILVFTQHQCQLVTLSASTCWRI